MPEFEVGLGLGSNIGDKAANIFQSLRLLAADGRVRIDKISPLYRTAPWGHVAQDFFANACALITTQMSPLDLLAFVKNIEAAMGRAQSERWGPRLIDIDLLYYGDIVFHDAKLALPHPELFNRAFVLMQYFGYLRRDPNDAPDSDFSGYNFWLNKLNQFNGNFVNAEMVKAFITSGEYRNRFGP